MFKDKLKTELDEYKKYGSLFVITVLGLFWVNSFRIWVWYFEVFFSRS